MFHVKFAPRVKPNANEEEVKWQLNGHFPILCFNKLTVSKYIHKANEKKRRDSISHSWEILKRPENAVYCTQPSTQVMNKNNNKYKLKSWRAFCSGKKWILISTNDSYRDSNLNCVLSDWDEKVHDQLDIFMCVCTTRRIIFSRSRTRNCTCCGLKHSKICIKPFDCSIERAFWSSFFYCPSFHLIDIPHHNATTTIHIYKKTSSKKSRLGLLISPSRILFSSLFVTYWILL